MKYNPRIGELVYCYSSKLDEVIQCTIEGYYTEDYSIIKALQKVSDGYIRHVIPVDLISNNKEDIDIIAAKLRREKVNETLSSEVYSGCVVNLKESETNTLVLDESGKPYKYQVIAVYTKQARVKLVTDYGEEIGMYNISDIVMTDEDPLFKMEDYNIGDIVTWAEYDNVYEGKIIKLHTSMAEIGEIRKLYPINFSRKIPYYRIPLNDVNKNIPIILTTIKDVIQDK